MTVAWRITVQCETAKVRKRAAYKVRYKMQTLKQDLDVLDQDVTTYKLRNQKCEM